MLLKQLKYFIFFLLTFLLGTQNTYAKTELVLSQGQLYFSIEQNHNFKSELSNFVGTDFIEQNLDKKL